MNEKLETVTVLDAVTDVVEGELTHPTDPKKVALIVAVSVLSCGLATGAYFGIKAWKKKKASKATAENCLETKETVDEDIFTFVEDVEEDDKAN